MFRVSFIPPHSPPAAGCQELSHIPWSYCLTPRNLVHYRASILLQGNSGQAFGSIPREDPGIHIEGATDKTLRTRNWRKTLTALMVPACINSPFNSKEILSFFLFYYFPFSAIITLCSLTPLLLVTSFHILLSLFQLSFFVSLSQHSFVIIT
jgi:hypothetical protein